MSESSTVDSADPAHAPFESILERLADVVARLESGDLPLETALAVFEEGVGLARAGAQRLDDAEQRVELLLAGGDGERVVTRPLNVPAPQGSTGSLVSKENVE